MHLTPLRGEKSKCTKVKPRSDGPRGGIRVVEVCELFAGIPLPIRAMPTEASTTTVVDRNGYTVEDIARYYINIHAVYVNPAAIDCRVTASLARNDDTGEEAAERRRAYASRGIRSQCKAGNSRRLTT